MQRWLLTIFLSLSALWLAGCAGTPTVVSNVSSFGSWPQGRAPGTYVFERLPSQQAQADVQAQLEAAAAPALAQAGFRQAADPQQADVAVQLSVQTREDANNRFDPFWGGRFGFGGMWGRGGFGGFGVGVRMEPTWLQIQASVLIRDRRTNAVLYETHAKHDTTQRFDMSLMPSLYEAALKDFPHPAVSPRTVTITPAQPQR